MEASNALDIKEALHGEDGARPYIPQSTSETALEALKNTLDSQSLHILEQVVASFLVQDSCVGLIALLEETKRDLAMLSKVFDVPAWSQDALQILLPIQSYLQTNSAKDLDSLRGETTSPLRDYLSPQNSKIPPAQQRALRAVRGLITLNTLSGRAQISRVLAKELKGWMSGKYPRGLTPNGLHPVAMWEICKALPQDSLTARLLNQCISALKVKLSNPFRAVIPSFTTIASNQGSEHGNVIPSSDEKQDDDGVTSDIPTDPFRGLLAEPSNASARRFCGLHTFQTVYPFELERLGPKIIKHIRGKYRDEALAALLSLFSRVLPSAFARIPMGRNNVAGLWIDLKIGAICWNFDEALFSARDGEHFVRSPQDRIVIILLPFEVVTELRRRETEFGHLNSVADLFQGQITSLGKTTKAFLRGISDSSHRPSLTKLARSWGRYLLNKCHDEVYASALGIDFTLGTDANFHYVRLRGNRIGTILKSAYQQIGFSGDLATTEVPDVGSLRLPDEQVMSDFLRSTLDETKIFIEKFPRRASLEKLCETHNQIATKIYAVLMLLLGSRPLEEGTITGYRIDLITGLVSISDKRTAPYHERRICLLPPTLQQWVQAYVKWIHLVAYRLYAEDRAIALTILSATESNLDGDIHPLFFRFTKKLQTAALGSTDQAIIYSKFTIENNGGRHFLDWLFRDAEVDSASIMLWMGRCNPGQEVAGSGSMAIPKVALSACADILENWLIKLNLPSAPILNPRQLPPNSTPQFKAKYLPKLLKAKPSNASILWPAFQGAVEPCPYADSTVILASLFPDIFSEWRKRPPPDGWTGIILSLVLEDGLVLEAEVLGVIQQLQEGTIFHDELDAFVDTTTHSLGIRRTWFSTTSIRLIDRFFQEKHCLSEPKQILDEADAVLRTHLPATRGRGIHFIMASAFAFMSCRIPAALAAWAQGRRFARTSRPETVARHLSGHIEPPTFDTQRRRRSIAGVNAVQEAFRKAEDILNVHGGSHTSAIDTLKTELLMAGNEYEYPSADAFQVGYVLHLCADQENLWSIERYESGVRQFLKLAALSIQENGDEGTNWEDVVTVALSDEKTHGNSPERTAINHALEWLGIDVHAYRRKGAPPSAFKYSERLSEREYQTALELLKSHCKKIGDDWYLAGLALKLLNEAAHRWDGLAHMRLCDIALDPATPFIVIVEEAKGALKTGNAPRVLEQNDAELIAELKQVCALRDARFPGDDLVPIFGDLGNSRTIGTAARIHSLITEALWRATGSPYIQVHDMRHTVISRQIGERMETSTQGKHDTLTLRQGLFKIAFDAGQAGPKVAIENYGDDFDRYRRFHYSRIIDELNCLPSNRFLCKLTGVSEETYRKRESRKSADSRHALEGFNWEKFKIGGSRIPLKSLVAIGMEQITWTTEALKEDALTGGGIYLGLRLLNESETISRQASGISEESARRTEAQLGKLNQPRISVLEARPDINRQRFFDAMLTSRLAVAMHATAPHKSIIQRVLTAFQSVGDEWSFATPEDALDLSPWIAAWNANGILTEFCLKGSGRSQLDSSRLNRAYLASFSEARLIPSRHFTRNTSVILRFSYQRHKDRSVSFRASPNLSFLLSVCALTIFIQP